MWWLETTLCHSPSWEVDSLVNSPSNKQRSEGRPSLEPSCRDCVITPSPTGKELLKHTSTSHAETAAYTTCVHHLHIEWKSECMQQRNMRLGPTRAMQQCDESKAHMGNTGFRHAPPLFPFVNSGKREPPRTNTEAAEPDNNAPQAPLRPHLPLMGGLRPRP